MNIFSDNIEPGDFRRARSAPEWPDVKFNLWWSGGDDFAVHGSTRINGRRAGALCRVRDPRDEALKAQARSEVVESLTRLAESGEVV